MRFIPGSDLFFFFSYDVPFAISLVIIYLYIIIISEPLALNNLLRNSFGFRTQIPRSEC